MNDASARQTSESAGTLVLTFRMLGLCARGEGRAIVAGMLLMLIGAGVALLQPWPLKIVLDSVLSEAPAPMRLDRLATAVGPGSPKTSLLAIACVGLLLIQTVAGLLTVLSTWVLVGSGLRMVYRLRCALFDHVQKLSLRFHDRTSVGDSLYRVTWDTYAAQSIFNSGIVPAATAILTLLGIVAIMLTRDIFVLGIALLAGLPLALLMRWLEKPMTRHSMRVRQHESDLSQRVQETIGGIRAVQAFGREAYESQRFRENAESSLRASLRLTVLQTAAQSGVALVLAAATALVVWISASRVLRNRLTPGDIVLLVSYVAMLLRPLEMLTNSVAVLHGSAAGARRVLGMLDTQPDVSDAPGAIPVAGRAKGEIRFEDVGFAYEKSRPVLRGVTLDIPAGQTLALVGPSGAGKTTLVSLILRFYDPDSGRMLLDGRDIRQLTLASLRANVGLVLQEPLLFATSIAENIGYGLRGASSAQIESAARSAGAHEFIVQLPDRYETRLGERGITLSAGQRQRISIARAFLKDAPILIMDEPTSALDAETEAQLLEAMRRLGAGRTTIVIAHRLSTIRDADRIVVLSEGSIVESGTHVQLMQNNGLYARLHASQFASREGHDAYL